MLRTLKTVMRQDKEKFKIPKSVQQAIPIQTLEILRLLSNLETEKRKLMQIVLFGQPELDQTLANPAIRQLLQRIAFSYRLTGLHKDELHPYLRHRLRTAGLAGGLLAYDGQLIDDARLVTAALQGGAALFVTGDARVLGWSPKDAMRIVSPRDAWGLLFNVDQA